MKSAKCKVQSAKSRNVQHSTESQQLTTGNLQLTTAPALPQRLKECTEKTMVQIAPNKWVPHHIAEPPQLSLCEWQPNGDGTFHPRPYEERMVKLDGKLARFLGFSGKWDTLHRLGRMGCVELIQVAPKLYMLNFISWLNHLRRCSEDPEFWDKGRGYIEEYRKTF